MPEALANRLDPGFLGTLMIILDGCMDQVPLLIGFGAWQKVQQDRLISFSIQTDQKQHRSDNCC